MKKCLYILLIVILLVPSLSGCEHFAPGGGQVDRPPLTPADDPAGTPSDGPAGEEDPTVDEYGFTLFPEGNYLADPKFDTDEFLPDYDVDISFVQHGSTDQRGVCATADTIYSYSDMNGKLMYTDKATGLTLPLCGKPECTHTDDTCNAYIGDDASGLRVYGGKLYWIEGGQTQAVMRMNLDGTARERVTGLNRMDIQVGGVRIGGDSTWTIHRGYVYVAGMLDTVVNGEPRSAFTVYAKPLDGGEGFTVMSSLQDGSGAYCAMRPVGNDLYIMTSSSGYEDRETREGPIVFLSFYRWNSKTRQAECLYSQGRGTSGSVGCYAGCFPLPVPGEGIYFCDVVESVDDTLAARILKLSFDTGTVEETGSFPVPETWPRFTAEHVVVSTLSGNSPLRFYDYNGELLFECGPFGTAVGGMLMGEDEQYAYYMCDNRKDFLAVPKDGGPVLTIQ